MAGLFTEVSDEALLKNIAFRVGHYGEFLPSKCTFPHEHFPVYIPIAGVPDEPPQWQPKAMNDGSEYEWNNIRTVTRAAEVLGDIDV